MNGLFDSSIIAKSSPGLFPLLAKDCNAPSVRVTRSRGFVGNRSVLPGLKRWEEPFKKIEADD